MTETTGRMPAAAEAAHPPGLPRRAEHLEDSRRALLQAARELFAEHGYAGTSTNEIATRARLTPGALYHNFGSKPALFARVLEEVEAEFITRLAAAGAPGGNVWESICNGCQAFLDVALEPEVQQIVLLDGPVVLGWTTWRAIEERYGFGLLRKFLSRAADLGYLPQRQVDGLVHLLSGALNEAALYMAHAPDRRAARAEIGEAVADLLHRLGRCPGPPGQASTDAVNDFEWPYPVEPPLPPNGSAHRLRGPSTEAVSGKPLDSRLNGAPS